MLTHLILDEPPVGSKLYVARSILNKLERGDYFNIKLENALYTLLQLINFFLMNNRNKSIHHFSVLVPLGTSLHPSTCSNRRRPT